MDYFDYVHKSCELEGYASGDKSIHDWFEVEGDDGVDCNHYVITGSVKDFVFYEELQRRLRHKLSGVIFGGDSLDDFKKKINTSIDNLAVEMEIERINSDPKIHHIKVVNKLELSIEHPQILERIRTKYKGSAYPCID